MGNVRDATASDEGLSVAVVSLGCARNLVDSEVMIGLLRQAGHRFVEDVRDADAIVVNTCGFIREAKEEAIEALLELSELKREGRCRALVCCGCLTQRYYAELPAELPEVDAFIGTGAIVELPAALKAIAAGERPTIVGEPEFLYSHDTPRVRTGPPWLTYIKIGEGCDHECAFCAIPAARGRMRSREVESVVTEFRSLAADGAVKEVVLIGQDTTSYGRDLYGRCMLPALLERLSECEFNGWVRLLYGHPAHLTDETIDAVVRSPHVVNYFDIPMQHAAPRILRAMGRQETVGENLRLIERVRERCPGAAIRTTFLVGFPGETSHDFEELLDFVTAARIDRVGGFVFSPEEDTPAATMADQVPRELAEERLIHLLAHQADVSKACNEALVGQRMQVLIEAVSDTEAVGRSYRDAPEVDAEVLVAGYRGEPGEFVTAVITEAEVHDLRGRAL